MWVCIYNSAVYLPPLFHLYALNERSLATQSINTQTHRYAQARRPYTFGRSPNDTSSILQFVNGMLRRTTFRRYDNSSTVYTVERHFIHTTIRQRYPPSNDTSSMLVFINSTRCRYNASSAGHIVERHFVHDTHGRIAPPQSPPSPHLFSFFLLLLFLSPPC